jgi:hypothetical protein
VNQQLNFVGKVLTSETMAKSHAPYPLPVSIAWHLNASISK